MEALHTDPDDSQARAKHEERFHKATGQVRQLLHARA